MRDETSLVTYYDVGYKNAKMTKEPLVGFLAGVDFDKILALPEAKKIIRSLPPQVIYFSLKRQGINECIDVLKHLSNAQFTRILDYDVWRDAQLDQVKALQWVTLMANHGTERLYKSFSALEEEYQISILQGLVRIYTQSEMEEMPPEKQDQLFAMPGNEVFYEILSDDVAIVEPIQMLLESAFAHDMRYATALLNFPFYMPPHESQELLKQFRSARLEEDGFVDEVESQKIFWEYDRKPLVEKYKSLVVDRSSADLQTWDENEDRIFTEKVLTYLRRQQVDIDEQFRIHQNLLTLANGLCSASKIEPDDIDGLRIILHQMKHLVGLGLEVLSFGQIEKAAQIIQFEHPKTLFKVGLSVIDDLRNEILQTLAASGLGFAERCQKLHKLRKWGMILAEFDQHGRDILGFETTEALKALFNRYPLKTTASADDQLTFEPIGSRRTLVELVGQIGAVGRVVSLAAEFSGGTLQGSLEKSINTMIVRHLVTGELGTAPLGAGDFAAYSELTPADRETRLSALREALSSKVELGIASDEVWKIFLDHYHGISLTKGSIQHLCFSKE
ncbi:MAG: DUF6178 family protein [Oligoflexales bacterium]